LFSIFIQHTFNTRSSNFVNKFYQVTILQFCIALYLGYGVIYYFRDNVVLLLSKLIQKFMKIYHEL
jgi:sugar phosphate permease